ncbi:MAG: hypothetical protein ACRD2Z_11305 [Thermoanaerobaculia bacterium]
MLTNGMTRAEFVSLYQDLVAVQYQPPACVAGQEMFDDVPASNPLCPWIEELSRRGITVGCGGSNYCPDAPATRDQLAVFAVRSMEACPTLDPTDEMIRVGGVCIDKYEASVWDAPTGGNQLTTEAEIDALCPDDGQDCKDKIFARSVAGVLPTNSLTWFQAQQALANSGKRLPSNAEWQMAVSGTPNGAPCLSGALRNTGAEAGCVSDWGVFDMVGNIAEWVATWVPASSPSVLGCLPWLDVGDFSSDADMCLWGARDNPGGTSAMFRGGAWSGGIAAGPFSVYGDHLPQQAFFYNGFRGAR